MIQDLIIALLFLAAGGYLLVTDLKKRKKCSVSSTATLVEVKSSVRKGRRNYRPVYEFIASGRHIRGDGDVLSSRSRKKFQIGDSVEILYNPDNPEEFRVQGKIGVLVCAVILLVFGGIVIFSTVAI